eukprot:104237_1
MSANLGNSPIGIETAQHQRQCAIDKICKFEIALSRNADPDVKNALEDQLGKLRLEFQHWDETIDGMVHTEVTAASEGFSSDLSFGSASPPPYSNGRKPHQISKNLQKRMMCLFKSVPLIELSAFSKWYSRIFREAFVLGKTGFSDLAKLLSSVEGLVEIERDGKIMFRNPEVVCYRFGHFGICECGLLCDGESRRVPVNFRLQQCDRDLQSSRCKRKGCRFLHTRSGYI